MIPRVLLPKSYQIMILLLSGPVLPFGQRNTGGVVHLAGHGGLLQ